MSSQKKRGREGTTQGDAKTLEVPGGEVLADAYYFPLERTKEAATYLRSHGAAVIRGAITAEEVAASLSAVTCWLSRWTDKGEWPNKTALVSVEGAGQSEGAWRARGADGVQQLFADVWGVPRDDLVTSMDAVILWREQTQGLDLHRDRPEEVTVDVAGRPLPVVQSLCVLTASTVKTGGFVCCPGEDFATSNALPWRHVRAQPGDLICWDAGCRHGSVEAARTDTGPLGRASHRLCRVAQGPPVPVSPVRVAVPVCMVPRHSMEAGVVDERKQLFRTGRSACHDSWTKANFARHPGTKPLGYVLPHTQPWWSKSMARVRGFKIMCNM